MENGFPILTSLLILSVEEENVPMGQEVRLLEERAVSILAQEKRKDGVGNELCVGNEKRRVSNTRLFLLSGAKM